MQTQKVWFDASEMIRKKIDELIRPQQKSPSPIHVHDFVTFQAYPGNSIYQIKLKLNETKRRGDGRIAKT